MFVASHTCSLFFSHNYSLFCLQSFRKHYTYSVAVHDGDLQTCNFTQGWLNSYWLLPALSCLFICSHLQSLEYSQSRRFAISMYLCIAYTLPLVAFAFDAFAFLLLFVFVAFAYCFQCKRYYVVSNNIKWIPSHQRLMRKRVIFLIKIKY